LILFSNSNYPSLRRTPPRRRCLAGRCRSSSSGWWRRPTALWARGTWCGARGSSQGGRTLCTAKAIASRIIVSSRFLGICSHVVMLRRNGSRWPTYFILKYRVSTMNVNKIWWLWERRTLDVLLERTKNKFFFSKSFGDNCIIYASLS